MLRVVTTYLLLLINKLKDTPGDITASGREYRCGTLGGDLSGVYCVSWISWSGT